MTAALEDLLDQLETALQRGAISDLAALSAALEASAKSLPAMTAARAEGLRRRAEGNQKCLQAALRGVRAAAARIATLSGGGPKLSTYGADGQRVLIGSTGGMRSARL